MFLAEAVRFELTEGSHPRRFSRPVHSTALPPLRRMGDIPEHARLSTGVVHSAKLFSDNLSHRPVARTIACLVILLSSGEHSPDRAPDTEFGGSL